MNYEKHYKKLIQRSKNRILKGYIERHHIIPRSLGGSDEEINIVKLTAREHFIAHILLYKMQTNKRSQYKMLNACMIFKGKNKRYINSKLYEAAKLKRSINQKILYSGKNHPMYGVHRYGELNPFYGKTHSEEARKKISEKTKNKVLCKDIKTGKKFKVSKEEFNNNEDLVGSTKGDKLTEETKYKCGNSARGKIYITNGKEEKRIFESELSKHSDYVKGRLMHICEYCNKKASIQMYKRWHGENCKIMQNYRY